MALIQDLLRLQPDIAQTLDEKSFRVLGVFLKKHQRPSRMGSIERIMHAAQEAGLPVALSGHSVYTLAEIEFLFDVYDFNSNESGSATTAEPSAESQKSATPDTVSDNATESGKKPRKPRTHNLHSRACIRQFKINRKIDPSESMLSVVRWYVDENSTDEKPLSVKSIYRTLNDHSDEWSDKSPT